MKRLPFLLLISLISFNLFSQDLIVTTDGDSVNCSIHKEDDQFLYFNYNHEDEVRSTLIPRSDVSSYAFDYYFWDLTIEKFERYPHFRFSLNGGNSFQTAKIAENTPEEFQQYVKELKSGFHLGADAIYYIREKYGIGLKYSLFKSRNSVDKIYVMDPFGVTRYGKMEDNISIHYIGPVYSTRFLNATKKNAFLFNMSLGYVNYVNNCIVIEDFVIKGGNFAMAFDIGYDIGLSENIQVGFQLSSILGVISKYKISDETTTRTIELDPKTDELISASRLDFSTGLRFVF